MTNEEKAREIASHYIYDNEVMHYEHGDVAYEFETFGEETEDAALEMAEWKDHQFKEYLEKKKIEADISMGKAYESVSQWDFYIAEQNKQLITKIINELFKED